MVGSVSHLHFNPFISFPLIWFHIFEKKSALLADVVLSFPKPSKMRCVANCRCFLCLELRDLNNNVKCDRTISDNFILGKPTFKPYNDFKNKSLTFFGMENEDTNNNMENIDTKDIICKKTAEPFDKIELIEGNPPKTSEESRHKSVIYISDKEGNNNPDGNELSLNGGSNILHSVVLDEFMSLNSSDCSNVINVVFKDTYPYALKLISDVNNPYAEDSAEDFPLGVEADVFNRNYRRRQRYINQQCFEFRNNYKVRIFI